MPKIVDHRERRTQLAEAVIRMVARDGLGAVSLRHVAQEANVSTGMVQHYFRSKDEMMAFALQVVSERVEERLAQRFHRHAGGRASSRTVVRDLLVEMLPVDEVRRREGLVALAFRAHAAVHPDLADRLRRDTDGLRAFLAERIVDAQRSGEAPAHRQPDHEAVTLLALVEGLSLHVLGRSYDAAAALQVFETHLDTLFGSADAARPGAGRT